MRALFERLIAAIKSFFKLLFGPDPKMVVHQLPTGSAQELWVNGGRQTFFADGLEHRQYDNGDEVFLRYGHVVAYKTHDGLEWKGDNQ